MQANQTNSMIPLRLFDQWTGKAGGILRLWERVSRFKLPSLSPSLTEGKRRRWDQLLFGCVGKSWLSTQNVVLTTLKKMMWKRAGSFSFHQNWR